MWVFGGRHNSHFLDYWSEDKCGDSKGNMINFVTAFTLMLVHRTMSTYCGTPGHPSGGSVLLPGSESDRNRYFDAGTIVKYSCNKGRIMFGTGVRECLENGSWSSTIPICSK